MKKLLFSLLVITTFFSCNTADRNNEVEDISNHNPVLQDTASAEEEKLANPYFLSVEKWDSLKHDETAAYYIVNYAGAKSENHAIKMVDSLLPNFPEAGYLWIPDYASLSGKELYAVFLYQDKYDFSTMEFLQENKKEITSIYAVRVDQSKDRWVAYSPIDIRINGEKQKMILTYSKPEEEEEYFDGGGEDWMWFTYDVSEFFKKHHPEILFETVFYSGLLPEEIEKIETAVDPSGFGYIFMDGNDYGYYGHDLPDLVITEACNFFGFEEPNFDEGY